jgi:hypothetical protein
MSTLSTIGADTKGQVKDLQQCSLLQAVHAICLLSRPVAFPEDDVNRTDRAEDSADVSELCQAIQRVQSSRRQLRAFLSSEGSRGGKSC